jgi:hypothetical protein
MFLWKLDEKSAKPSPVLQIFALLLAGFIFKKVLGYNWIGVFASVHTCLMHYALFYEFCQQHLVLDAVGKQYTRECSGNKIYTSSLH